MSNLYNHHKVLMVKTTGLQIYATNISREDFSLTSIPKAVLNKLSSIYMVISERLNSFTSIKHSHDNNAYVKELLTIKQGKVLELAKMEYALVKDYNVPTIIGLKTNMIVASETVTDGLTKIDKCIFPIAEEIDKFIGQVCMSEDIRTASRPIASNKLLETLVLELNKNMDKCFDTNKVGDMDKFYNLYPNTSCLPAIYNILTNNGRFVNVDNMQRVVEMTKSLQGKIDALMKSMEETDFAISKPVLIKLSNDIENMAQLVTTVSSYIHWYDQLVKVFTNTLQAMDQLNQKTR